MEPENRKIRSFKDLGAWREGHKLVLTVYRLSKKFPKDELFGLTNQIRRAAVSITSNIAEGFGRNSAKEKHQFYSIARGSVTEVQNQLLVAKDVAYITPDEFSEADTQADLVHKIITGLAKSTRFLPVSAIFYILLSLGCALAPAGLAHASVIGMPGNNLGLVGYWSLNEGTSTIAHDFSGNGNNGTLSGSTLPTWTSGKLGNALSFSHSSSQYVSLPNIASSNQSISAWIYNTSFASGVNPDYGHDPVAKGYDAENGYFGFYIDGGDHTVAALARTSASGAFSAVSLSALNPNTWYFVTATKDGSNLKLYVNGVLQNTTPYSGTDISSSAWSIGRQNDPGAPQYDYYFDGLIDEVRIYNRALTATEVAGLYQNGLAKINVSQSPGTLSQGLVGWWTMDGADTVWSSPTAGVEYDSSGSDDTGTLNGMTRSGSPTVGKIGQALSFNGSACLYNTEDFADAYLQNDYTISAWVKTGANGNNEEVIFSTYRGYGGENLEFQVGESIYGQQFMGFEDLNGIVSGSNLVNDGNWHLVTGVRTVSGLDTLYVDGQQVYQYTGNTGTLSYSSGNYDAEVGATSQCTSSFMNGSIDDARIYDRALSASEIQQLYTLGAGTHVNTSSANLQDGSSLSQGLVGLWTFDGSDISGSTIYDLSGNGNDGANNGAVPTIGKLGQALSFDGSSSYVNMGNVLNMGTNSWTASAWIKTTDTSTLAGIVGKSLAGEQIGRWSILMNDGGDNLECIATNDSTGDGIAVTTSGASYQDGNWHLITCVWDRSGNLTIYMDGVAQNSTDISAYAGVNFSTTDDLYVGAYQDATGLSPVYYFPGSIDDMRVYDRALSASEVQDLYLMGK